MQRINYLTAAIFLTCVLAFPPASFAKSAKKKYTCTDGLVKINFSVTPGKGAAPDKVSGSVTFIRPKVTQKLNGQYEPVTDTFIATTKNVQGKNKAISGFYDEDNDRFLISAKIAKKVSSDYICPNKKIAENLLSGDWVINGPSFIPVTINEDVGGNITGKGGKGFDGYTLNGKRSGDSISILLKSPDGNDDILYTLTLCGSSLSMEGSSSDPFALTATWCKKGVAKRQECPPDPSC